MEGQWNLAGGRRITGTARANSFCAWAIRDMHSVSNFLCIFFLRFCVTRVTRPRASALYQRSSDGRVAQSFVVLIRRVFDRYLIRSPVIICRSRVREPKMADQQRVHPSTDEEQSMRPSAPLAPKPSFSSENGDPQAFNNRKAAMPVQQPPAPRYFSKPPPRRNPCCRCLAWLFCFLFLVIVIVAIAGVVIYLVFQPRVPKYSVESVQITKFDPNVEDSSITSQFVVKIRARNPNKKIGIYYKDDSYLAVSYTGTELCSGKLPDFYQGHKNTTVMVVALSGTNVHLNDGLLSTLQTQQQEGSVPLNIRADVPVKIKMGGLKSWKITFHVRCTLIVNSLSANENISIKSRRCKVKI